MTVGAFLARYEQVLLALQEAEDGNVEEQLLEALLVRDRLQAIMADDSLDAISAQELLQVISCDKALRRTVAALQHQPQLSDWRNNLRPEPSAWWWYLDEARLHIADRHDWLWNLVSLILFALALGLLADTVGRFLEGETDAVSTLAVVLQSGLALLTGSTLTNRGREALEQTFKQFNIPSYRWQEIKLLASVALLAMMFGIHRSLPAVAAWYSDRGLAYHQEGDLANAQADFNRALQLNPGDEIAHYNLGVLYEDLLEFDAAKKEYKIALSAGFDLAYNNLGRLHILDGNPELAVPLLLEGQELVPEEDTEVHYDFRKNLGWARLNQEHFVLAMHHLRRATDLQPEKAPAHCLMAQVLEAQHKETEALTSWESCLQYADSRRPDEDRWIQLARARLQVEGEP